MNGQQGGDPAKLGAPWSARRPRNPPLRFVAGADVVAGVEQKAHDLLDQVDAHRDAVLRHGPRQDDLNDPHASLQTDDRH